MTRDGRTIEKSIMVDLGWSNFPTEYTCEGDDTSPMIRISGIGADHFALIMDDPDAPNGTFTHWLIWDIKSNSEIPANISKTGSPKELPGATQGTNSGGEIGYMGPCPPSGKPHRYFVKVYGYNGALKLNPGSDKEDLEAEVDAIYLSYGEAMAIYKR